MKKILFLLFSTEFFSLRFLRSARWALYRKTYQQKTLYVGSHVKIHSAHKSKYSYLKVGSRCKISDYVYIDYSGGVNIKNNVSISEGAKIYTHDHDIRGDDIDWQNNNIVFSALDIEDYVWIGASSIILPSVSKIGRGSVIAAGAVLTKDAEPLGIYAGNPAKKVGIRHESQI